MLVLEKSPAREVPYGYESELRVERSDIVFHDLPGGRLRIQVTVHNTGQQCSRPTSMRLESAPLGAFVAWTPLARLVVPALEPGESRELSTEVARPRPIPLGDFSGVPPRRLLTALTSPEEPADERSQPGSGLMAWLKLMRRRQPTQPSRVDLSGKGSLAPDLWDLLGQGQPHWAGNINVFIGSHAVERHLAKALRVYLGRTNMAMFVVGDPGSHDAFAFGLAGVEADWKAALYDVTNHRSLVVGASDACIDENQWLESNGHLMVMLATRPPIGCSVGNVEVHVTRRTDRKTAIVEFSLDPAAQGTGCYFV